MSVTRKIARAAAIPPEKLLKSLCVVVHDFMKIHGLKKFFAVKLLNGYDFSYEPDNQNLCDSDYFLSICKGLNYYMLFNRIEKIVYSLTEKELKCHIKESEEISIDCEKPFNVLSANVLPLPYEKSTL